MRCSEELERRLSAFVDGDGVLVLPASSLVAAASA